MKFTGIRRRFVLILVPLTLLITCFVGMSAGFAVATSRNIGLIKDFGRDKELFLPTKVYDINGELITEFYSDEKRELVSLTDLPKNLILALITREDGSFFSHRGFSFYGTLRAMANNLLTNTTQGGSTLTQQLAGHLYAERRDVSYDRKLKELWWSFQVEKRLTKYEILELYMNKMPFGHGAYGVEAASQFYFNHPASENTVAESTLLVIQLANPAGRWSPIKNPEGAQLIQRSILNQMVDNGYIPKAEADGDYEDYWSNRHNWRLAAQSGAFITREDQAPWFSEYIRELLDGMLYGRQDLYRDGFTVYTTLNLEYQRKADEVTARGLEKWNKVYRSNLEQRLARSTRYTSIIDMLALVGNVNQARVGRTQMRKKALDNYYKSVNPVIHMMSMVFGVEGLNEATTEAYAANLRKQKQSTVQTAMVTLDNETGYILAMVGGSEFHRANQFNRAVKGSMMPGSVFKPLYYSAAISSGKYTVASHFRDAPRAFQNSDGTFYIPENYIGGWNGDVSLRQALARSMNVPSVTLLDGIGFDAAIDRAANLLGVRGEANIVRTFDRVYPMALGVLSANPLQIAQAYSTFANRGRFVEPLAIRYVEDRYGNVILNPEMELRERQREQNLQVLTPQAAYIMVNLLESTVRFGTLARVARRQEGFMALPVGGKTGTTQNWADAWTAVISPYHTSVVWAGFDQRGSTLGVYQTGATATGPVMVEYMAYINQRMPYRDFEVPSTGIEYAKISAASGLLPTEYCDDVVTEIFISGTVPTEYCQVHTFLMERDEELETRIGGTLSTFNLSVDIPPLVDPNASGYDELDPNRLLVDPNLMLPSAEEGNARREEDLSYILD